MLETPTLGLTLGRQPDAQLARAAGLAISGPRASAPEDMSVFVVEDEPGIRQAIMLTVQRAGYSARGFSDVNGLGFQEGQPRPFLIFLDVSLETSDAVEAIQKLSDLNYEGAVQIVSGRAAGLLDDIRNIGEMRQLNMLSAIRKPCRMQLIREVVEREASLHLATSISRPRPAASARPGGPQTAVSLEDALREDRLEVWYQPKVDLRTGALIGAECLSRIRQQGGSIASPGAFLPGATSAALERLTEVVLRRASADWLDFSAAGNPLKLSVNIPSEMLGGYPLAALVRSCIQAGSQWPGLVLEITEEDALKDVAKAKETATQLSIYGVELSIDDFGLGYSSLSRLRDIPFREIKLDRSLVDGSATDKVRGALCRAVVDLAHTLAATVVGEGIETSADLQYLSEIGCDIGQGYLLGRPMPKADLVRSISLRWPLREGAVNMACPPRADR